MSFTSARSLFPRQALQLALRRLKSSRALIVNGPRQAGKTALLHMLQAEVNGTYLSLDDVSNLRLSRTDPTGLVTGFPEPIFIDEVQRAGDQLLLTIKLQLDNSPQRGRFVLAGSTRFLTEPRLSESLAGRVRFVDLWPLSQGEIDGQPDGFVDTAFEQPSLFTQIDTPALSRSDVFKRVCRGGFPEAVLSDDLRDRRDFFADYIRTVTTKDIQELSDIGHNANMQEIVRLLAARTSSEMNIADLGKELGIPAQALRRYLPLLETLYLHYRIPAWSRNLTAKVTHRPKVHLTDTGLAAHLLGVDAAALARPTLPAAGPLLESFIAGEISRQLTWANTDATLYHWRDRSGREVDLLLEASDGRIVAIEVKAAIDVQNEDFAGLRTLRDRLGDQFISGIVVHCGDRPRPFGPKLWSVPVAMIWGA